jgi:hypothetical protein
MKSKSRPHVEPVEIASFLLSESQISLFPGIACDTRDISDVHACRQTKPNETHEQAHRASAEEIINVDMVKSFG